MLTVLAGRKYSWLRKVAVWISLTMTFQIESLIKTDCHRIKDLHFIHKSFCLSLQNLKRNNRNNLWTFKKQLMSAGRWNQSALKPHLVSNSKNIKDYYPQRQIGHEHLLQRVHAIFRRAISQGNTVTIQHQCQCKICEGQFLFCTRLKMNLRTCGLVVLAHQHLAAGPVLTQTQTLDSSGQQGCWFSSLTHDTKHSTYT